MNDLKVVNDSLGHLAGDTLIMNFAHIIRTSIPEKYFVGRYGGDEFIIIYAGASAEQVYAKAAALRQNIMDLKLEHLYSNALPIVTISQGIS